MSLTKTAIYFPDYNAYWFNEKLWLSQSCDEEEEVDVDEDGCERVLTRLYYPATMDKKGNIDLDRSIVPIVRVEDWTGEVEEDEDDDEEGYHWTECTSSVTYYDSRMMTSVVSFDILPMMKGPCTVDQMVDRLTLADALTKTK
jgi:hypothetical protein